MSDLISVIVPVYHVAQYLPKCVDSILGQSYPNLQVILVDDGSPDDCPAICDAYAVQDARVQVIHQANGGVSAARNAGLRVAKGNYLMFVDSDDTLRPQAIRVLYDTLVKSQADISVCNITRVTLQGEVLPEQTPSMQATTVSAESYFHLLAGQHHVCCVIACNKLYCASLWKDLWYDVGRYHEDEFIICKIIARCQTIAFCGQPLYDYLQRGDSMMGQASLPKTLDKAQAYLWRAEYFLSSDNTHLALQLYQLGVSTLVDGYRCLPHGDAQSVVKLATLQEGYRVLFRDHLGKQMSPLRKAASMVFYAAPRSYARLVAQLH